MKNRLQLSIVRDQFCEGHRRSPYPYRLRFGGTQNKSQGRTMLRHVGFMERAEVINPHGEKMPHFQPVLVVHENSR